MLAKLFDTMAAAQMLSPDLPKGLGRAVTILCDVRPWKHLKEEDLDTYNRMDVAATHCLAIKQLAVLRETGQLPVFEAMMRGLPVLMRMAQRGIKLDPVYQREWRRDLQDDLRDAITEWPITSVSPTSPTQILKWLKGSHGLDIEDAQEGTLKKAARQVPEVKIILKIRKAIKALSTYADVSVHGDGRVHPQYLVQDRDETKATFTQKGQGAGTGRPIARDPNIQNQTRDARRLYIPSGPGWCMASLDWSQAEARYDAARSGDERLAEAIDRPGGVPGWIQELLSIDRVPAKGTYYGTRNLGGPKTISEAINSDGYSITPNQVKEIQEQMFTLFPKWKAHRETIIAEGRALGYVTNAFGRRRFFYHKSAAPSMVGFDPQSGVADMLWRILPEADEKAVLLATVHDSLLIEAPKGEIEGRAAAVREVMEQPFPEVAPDFRVPVDVKIGAPGQSWGEMEETANNG